MIHRVRGCRDVVGIVDGRVFEGIENIAKTVSGEFGYNVIHTPILERLSLFNRCLHDTSDVVAKEMFIASRFLSSEKTNNNNNISVNKNDEENEEDVICLRPEGTAGIVRCILEEGLKNVGEQRKLYYFGPMFRYERPQHGRLRQFTQFGIEHIGCNKPASDVEAIMMAHEFLSKVSGYFNHHVVNSSSDGSSKHMSKQHGHNKLRLEINSLGDKESREIYQRKLHDYLTPKYQFLSPDSKFRYDRGAVLRILDTKDVNDIQLLKDAPSILECLNITSRKRLDTVVAALEKRMMVTNNGIGSSSQMPHVIINHKLVRGLDYYNDTVFEFVGTTIGSEKKDLTLLAGGRYDSLFSTLAGINTSNNKKSFQNIPGIGWAVGIERLALFYQDTNPLLKQRRNGRDTDVIVLSNPPKSENDEISLAVSDIATNLRKQFSMTTTSSQSSKCVRSYFSGSMKTIMTNAEEEDIPIAVIYDHSKQKIEIRRLSDRHSVHIDFNEQSKLSSIISELQQ